MTLRPLHQQYIVRKQPVVANPDPSIFCPVNGYLNPLLPNDDYFIIPKTSKNYGPLYNWFAATDSRSIANTGWHLPTRAEWTALGIFVATSWIHGGNNNAGGILKETGTAHWLNPNTGATNGVGFNARGAGYRITACYGINSEAAFIMPDLVSTTYRVASFGYNSEILNVDNVVRPKTYGGSVRLMKDSTILKNGETGIYIGINGMAYPTKCYGTQEWLVCNLAETTYLNGDPIPEVTDDTEWSLRQSGAFCLYNNDWSKL